MPRTFGRVDRCLLKVLTSQRSFTISDLPEISSARDNTPMDTGGIMGQVKVIFVDSDNSMQGKKLTKIVFSDGSAIEYNDDGMDASEFLEYMAISANWIVPMKDGAVKIYPTSSISHAIVK